MKIPYIRLKVYIFSINLIFSYSLKNSFGTPFFTFFSFRMALFLSYREKKQFFTTYIVDPVPMSPLLATRNSCELAMSFSDCLTDWGVDWWRGRGCLCVALLLGNGRVDTVAGGWVCVLWASCEVLTALGGSGSLPITDPDPDAANKTFLVMKHCPPLRRASREWIFNVYLSRLEKRGGGRASHQYLRECVLFFFFVKKLNKFSAKYRMF